MTEEAPAQDQGITRICCMCSATKGVTVAAHGERVSGPPQPLWGCESCTPAIKAIVNR